MSTFTPLDKPERRKSDVWKDFTMGMEDGKDVAKCNHCGRRFDSASKKGTSHLRNHLKSCQKKRNEGEASGSGDKPAGNSVSDQQLSHLDRNHFKSCQNKRNEGEASGSGDKPVGNSVMDQQLNHLDWVRTCIKQCYRGLPKQVGDANIINVYNEEKKKLRIYFKKLNCRFSLMIKNTVDGKYTWFMVHFIDDDWKLEKKIIGFKCIEGDQNMKVLKNVLLDLGIDNKVSSMATDGDDSDIYVLSTSDESENRFSGQGSLLSSCKFCVLDFYRIERTCPDFENEMDPVLFDHMSKIFNYIRETPSKIGTFRIAKDRARSLGKEVTAKDIPPEEMLEFMFSLDLVKIALGLKEAFFELENMDLHFKSINLTKEQWDVLTKFDQFCDEEADLYEIYRDFLYSKTANMYFPMLCRIYKKSLVVVTLNPFISGERYLWFVKDAKKCWDQCNWILAVAAVLDPRFKMDIVEQWYKKIYGDEYETQLEIFRDYFNSVYNEYAKGTDNFQSSISYDISGNSSHDQDSVTTTNQAVTALQLLREKKDQFDLVISDMHIGLKLLELVGLEMDLPVIMLSGNGDPKNIMKGITHGASDYLLKPVRLEELKNIWQHVVRKRKFGTKERNNTDSQDRPHHGSGEAAGCEGVFGTMSTPSETFTLTDPSLPSLFFYDNPNQTQEITHVGEQNVDQEMVGLDISKSSRNKQKKLRSDVWKMFKKCKDENGKDLAKCSLCEKLFDGSSKKGTTHLRNHFKSCQKKRNEGGASGSGDKPAGNSVTDQQLNHLDRVKMLIKQCDWVLPEELGDADITDVYNEEKEKLRIYFK
ncbi:hypothetical protein LWI29_008456 [Acer saccharum]|uniref:BED-type domain-containing protein n=1 Tax=Acer saccharum TaxID=4024 RepID=A0AA39W128_ACESA|nr:hypothetical protein LWI29_008456 [Acer saccharum]